MRIFGRRQARIDGERQRLRDERRLAEQAAAREAARPAARALDMAATELLLGIAEPLGRRLVGWVHRPWAEGRHLRGVAPSTPVLADTLRRAGLAPPLPLLESYAAADAALVATPGWSRGLDDELVGAFRWVPGVVAPGELPEAVTGHRCAAYDVATDRLHRISEDLATAGGGGLMVERALTTSRWWPGRSRQERHVEDPLHLYATFRTLEGREGGWYASWAAAGDLAAKGEGLPDLDPADWLLAAFRQTPVDAGGLGLSRPGPGRPGA